MVDHRRRWAMKKVKSQTRRRAIVTGKIGIGDYRKKKRPASKSTHIRRRFLADSVPLQLRVSHAECLWAKRLAADSLPEYHVYRVETPQVRVSDTASREPPPPSFRKTFLHDIKPARGGPFTKNWVRREKACEQNTNGPYDCDAPYVSIHRTRRDCISMVSYQHELR